MTLRQLTSLGLSMGSNAALDHFQVLLLILESIKGLYRGLAFVLYSLFICMFLYFLQEKFLLILPPGEIIFAL